MEEAEMKVASSALPSRQGYARPPVTASGVTAANSLAPQGCATCGTAPPSNGEAAAPSYVYALGRIEPRFPRISVEKEFSQATGRAATAGLTDRQTLQVVLSKRENRYLVRQLCWVMTIEGLETYILAPRDPVDFDLLVAALRPTPQPWDLDFAGLSLPRKCATG